MTHMVHATISGMDLRARAVHAHEQAELEIEHERHKTAGAAAEQLADEARRYIIDKLELDGADLDSLRVLVTPGATTAVIHIGDLPAFQYRRRFDMRSLHTCGECGARTAGPRVAELADLGELLLDLDALGEDERLLLYDHDRADDPTWRCNGLRSWSTVQQPPTFHVELVPRYLVDGGDTAERVAASLNRMAAVTANPADIYADSSGWLIVARFDPDPPGYDGEEPF